MARILITGAAGFLGQSVVSEFERNYPQLEKLITFRSKEYDLTKSESVKQLLIDKPADIIVHLAARVGGIGANMENPGRFFYENLMMGVQLIEQARLAGIKKIVCVGTICSYPKFTPVPFRETDFWSGYPEETNAPYGLAKKMLTVQLQAYRKQYGFCGVTILPVNLYGPRDNFELNSSHVIPAMIRKFHCAKEQGDSYVTLWGDGSPTREFLYVEDCARAIRLATERYDSDEPINIGSGFEVSMHELARTICEIVGYQGEIRWDTSKPNGQPRRCLDVSRAKSEIGFSANVLLPYGIEQTYKWYLSNKDEILSLERKTAPFVHPSN